MMFVMHQQLSLRAFCELLIQTRSKICFHTTCSFSKTTPKNVGSDGSVAWMERHINDPYVKKSRYQNYRARSAFKLIELDDKHNLLKPGQCVVDLGAAPGAWTQVLVERVNSLGKDAKQRKGLVIGVDLSHIITVPGAILVGNSDFTKDSTKEKLCSLLKGQAVDVVLSDMCPNLSGQSQIDSTIITDLAFQTLQFAVQSLKTGGHIVVKGFDGMEAQKFYACLEKFFKIQRRTKPPASRNDSSEMYFIGKDFKGIVTNKSMV